MSCPPWILWADCTNDLVLRTKINYFETHFVGKPMRVAWNPPAIRIQGKSKPIRDMISWLPSAPVVSEKAVAALQSLIGEYCEFLPLIELRGEPFFAINVLSICDCLDHGDSEIFYSDSDPMHIVEISSYAFIENKLPPALPIFKIPDDLGTVFVQQSFIDLVIQRELRGFSFGDPSVEPLGKMMKDGNLNVIPNLPQ